MNMAKVKYSLFKAIEELIKCINGRDIDITTIMPDVNDGSIQTGEKPDIRALRCNFNYAGMHTPETIILAPNWDRAAQATTINLLHPSNVAILAQVCRVKEITDLSPQANTNESILDEICQAEWEQKDTEFWTTMFEDLDDDLGRLGIMPLFSGMIIGGFNGQGLLYFQSDRSIYIFGLDYNALIEYHADSMYDYYCFELLTRFVDGNNDNIPDGSVNDKAWFYGLRNEFGVEDATNDGSKGMLVLSLNQYNGTSNAFIANASPDYLIPDKYTQLFDKQSNSANPGGVSPIDPGQLAP